MSDPRALLEHELGLAGEIMARAFQEDPLQKALHPALARRVDFMRRYFTLAIEASFLDAEILGSGEPLRGVVLGWRPELRAPRVSRLLRVLPAVVGCGLRQVLRVSRSEHELARRRPRYDHWFVSGLAVEPGSQRKGLGGALLGAITRRADEAGMPVYLDTTNPANVPFYVARGFVVEAEFLTLRGAGPRAWCLVRREGGQ